MCQESIAFLDILKRHLQNFREINGLDVLKVSIVIYLRGYRTFRQFGLNV